MAEIPGFLRHIVDYAGLFPPSKLPMEEAVANYAGYRTGPEKEMLGPFVVAVDRVSAMLAAGEDQRLSFRPAWPLSLLMGGNRGEAAIRLQELRRDEVRVEVVALESKAQSPDEIAGLREQFGAEVPLYVEIPWSENPAPWVEEARHHGARAKIRCGGVEASMIPPLEAVGRFLRTCIDAELPFKATAGLHHPVRAEHPLTYEANAPRAKMHGYLNLFVAALLYRCGLIEANTIDEVLADENPASFHLEAGVVGWRDHRVDADGVARLRPDFATGFGSCSFREPVDDLKNLEML